MWGCRPLPPSHQPLLLCPSPTLLPLSYCQFTKYGVGAIPKVLTTDGQKART